MKEKYYILYKPVLFGIGEDSKKCMEEINVANNLNEIIKEVTQEEYEKIYQNHNVIPNKREFLSGE